MYICIDLKSFFASVECVERGLDPMKTNLVVADPTRTEKTICLAITPPMKKLGIPNRCRVFQIPKEVEYIMAPPRMKTYIDYSARVYEIYLKYISKDDIHVYSIDEAFLDVTEYLNMYQMSAKELGMCIMADIKKTLGLTATCGIGTNLYLAKIALDITAKHATDFIGMLDEESYKEKLWRHKPLKDFWRVGAGTQKTLEKYGIYTMEQIAHTDENLLYRLFGIDAELLIDHAWGREITTIADIKAYKSSTNSISSGQVLQREYAFEEGKLVTKEMADGMCLELVDKGLVTRSVTLHISYENKWNLKAAHGTAQTLVKTDSPRLIVPCVEKLYEEIVRPDATIRKINVTFNNIVEEAYAQYNLFSTPEEDKRERQVQKAMLDIKKKFGKNAILKGMNLQENATAMERNRQIGGHNSGEQ